MVAGLEGLLPRRFLRADVGGGVGLRRGLLLRGAGGGLRLSGGLRLGLRLGGRLVGLALLLAREVLGLDLSPGTTR